MKSNALIVVADNMDAGGVESYLLQALPSSGLLDHFSFTYLVPGTVLSEPTKSKVESLGVDVRVGELHNLNHIERRRRFGELIASELNAKDYDVVHVNTGVKSVQAIALRIANEHGVKTRIAHSHNAIGSHASLAGRIASPFLTPIINRNATHLVAPSVDAGEYVFGKSAWYKRGKLLRNGIEASRFKFSNQVRAQIRRGLSDSTFVIGTVGRLTSQKNHPFLLSVFSCLLHECTNAQLWIVGGGPMEFQLKNRARELGISEKIVFYGERGNVQDYLMGMDAFAFPSLFEGLGISAVEAQATGLPCIVSDKVPRDADIPGCKIDHISLRHSDRYWAKCLLDLRSCKRTEHATEKVIRFGYDVSSAAHALARCYEQ